MTEINGEHRRETIGKSLAVYHDKDGDKGLKKTLQIEYRGQNIVLPVISVDPTILLLNHHNNRLSAQLHDHPSRNVVYDNPTSSSAQDILADLLSKTTEFKDLQEQLERIGQQNPGLITRNGLLVNGNTRVVALRKLGKPGVDVAVLPDDADDAAILDLEMFLQMVHLTHQDYTFTNELLLIEKCRSLGNSDKQIADKMKWNRGWQKKVDEKFQLLRLIKEIRALSATPLAYHVFDTKSQHLRDLNDEFQSLSKSDLVAANQMKWSRITAMFLGVNKDQTRAIDEQFISEDVAKRLEPNSQLSGFLDSLKKVTIDDGLDDILGTSGAVGEQLDAKTLAQKVINSRVDESGNVSTDLNDLYDDLRKKIILSAEELITKNKRRSILATPAEELREIRESLENVVMLFGEVSHQTDFDIKKFAYELQKAQASLDDLNKKVVAFKQ